jgi:anti-sigma factor RsiW
MNCEWREKTGLYVDGELEPAAQQAFAGHLQDCSDCSAAVLEQQELKKAVRLAGKRFSAPPELYSQVRKQVRPPARAGMWLRLGLAAACVVMFAAVGVAWLSRSRGDDATVAQLVDQHVTMLASANPVDVVSSNKHVVKPWYQGKLPFTFNPPEPTVDSSFVLIGGRLVYAQHAPGAELVYQVRQHRLSVFIFQARDVHGAPSASDHAFTVNGWQQGGLQYYVVTDAAREDAERLRALFEEANRT